MLSGPADAAGDVVASVNITSPTDGVVIRFTTDGTVPNESSPVYTPGKLTLTAPIDTGTTQAEIQAIAFGPAIQSDMAAKMIEFPKVSEPLCIMYFIDFNSIAVVGS